MVVRDVRQVVHLVFDIHAEDLHHSGQNLLAGEKFLPHGRRVMVGQQAEQGSMGFLNDVDVALHPVGIAGVFQERHERVAFFYVHHVFHHAVVGVVQGFQHRVVGSDVIVEVVELVDRLALAHAVIHLRAAHVVHQHGHGLQACLGVQLTERPACAAEVDHQTLVRDQLADVSQIGLGGLHAGVAAGVEVGRRHAGGLLCKQRLMDAKQVVAVTAAKQDAVGVLCLSEVLDRGCGHEQDRDVDADLQFHFLECRHPPG